MTINDSYIVIIQLFSRVSVLNPKVSNNIDPERFSLH
jgi:hypothetical protein